MKTHVLPAALLLALLWLAGAAPVDAQDSSDLCATPGNLTVNCRFDGGFHPQPGAGKVANGYFGYVVAGSATLDDLACDSPEQPCQRGYASAAPWEAGIGQVINTTPGAGYRARIGWLTSECDDAGNTGRIGIDPYGGTDPRSTNIIWNDWIRLNKGNGYGIHQVKASAVGAKITVFISARIMFPCKSNTTWFDAVIAVPDGSAPPPPAAATDTPAPPTNTPLPRPTATRTNTPVPAATNTPLPAATNTAAPTAPPTPTITIMPTAIALAATNTPAAANTPRPTATTARRLTPTPTPQPDFLQGNMDFIALGLVTLAACALFVAIAMAAFAFWFWKRK